MSSPLRAPSVYALSRKPCLHPDPHLLGPPPTSALTLIFLLPPEGQQACRCPVHQLPDNHHGSVAAEC